MHTLPHLQVYWSLLLVGLILVNVGLVAFGVLNFIVIGIRVFLEELVFTDIAVHVVAVRLAELVPCFVAHVPLAATVLPRFPFD